MKYFIIFLIYFLGFINITYSAKVYDKLIISDYGEYSLIPPNTLFALDLAKMHDAEYLSINLNITKDGELILYDEYYLSDKVNLDFLLEKQNKNLSVLDLNLASIKKLKLKYGVKDSKNNNVFENLFNILTIDEYVSFLNYLYKNSNKKLKFYVKISDTEIYKKKNIDLSKQIIEKFQSLNYSDNQIILEYSDVEEIKRVRTKLGFKGKIVYKILPDKLIFLYENTENNDESAKVKIVDFIDNISIFVDYVAIPVSKVILNKSYDHFFVSSLVDEIKKTQMKVLVYNDIKTKKLPDNFKNYREIAILLLKDLDVDGILTDQYNVVKNITRYLKN